MIWGATPDIGSIQPRVSWHNKSWRGITAISGKEHIIITHLIPIYLRGLQFLVILFAPWKIKHLLIQPVTRKLPTTHTIPSAPKLHG